MKDIKFRLIKNKKIVGYESHVIDPLIDKGICVYHKDLNEQYLKYGYPITSGDSYFIFHDQKDQYTGLKDKNNIEIYERDIIKFIDDMKMVVTQERELIVGQIKWIDGAFWCYYEEDEYLTRLVSVMTNYWSEELQNNQIEKIGNIYENPELLEVQNEI